MTDAGSIPQSEAIAFFLTWTTYGSWLPGDARGWFDRRGRFQSPRPSVAFVAERRLAERPVVFDDRQRSAVERAVEAHCRHRGWHLHAVHCRREHVHAVVTAVGRSPDDVLAQLKAWCTRVLAAGGDGTRRRWWTEGGSKRWVFHECDLVDVVAYVKECQGVPTRSYSESE